MMNPTTRVDSRPSRDRRDADSVESPERHCFFATFGGTLANSPLTRTRTVKAVRQSLLRFSFSMGLGAAGEDDPERALREVRGRFIAAFPGRCDSVAALLADAAADQARAVGARQIAHRLTGLAGAVGFPTVSARAAELEALLTSPSIDAALARDLLGGIREA